MPLSDTADPVVRAVRDLQDGYRRLLRAMLVLFTLILVGLGSALYLRSNDLEHLTHEGNRATVRECFRSAAQRPQYRRLLHDPSLSDGVKNLIHAAYVNAPSVVECRELADRFHIAAEE